MKPANFKNTITVDKAIQLGKPGIAGIRLSTTQRKALEQGRLNKKNGNFLNFDELLASL